MEFKIFYIFDIILILFLKNYWNKGFLLNYRFSKCRFYMKNNISFSISDRYCELRV